MTTSTQTITEFLRDRITDDEARAREWENNGAEVAIESHGDWISFESEPWKRVLAECEAKRRIVNRITAGDHHPDAMPELERILRSLASVYADHPDYRDEWRA